MNAFIDNEKQGPTYAIQLYQLYKKGVMIFYNTYKSIRY